MIKNPPRLSDVLKMGRNPRADAGRQPPKRRGWQGTTIQPTVQVGFDPKSATRKSIFFACNKNDRAIVYRE
jgi:hypothetical protein